MKTYICIHCNDEYEPQTEKEKRASVSQRYCPYCQVVLNSDPDPTWLPSVRKDEIEKKGFHKC